jgi:hypothetical protein
MRGIRKRPEGAHAEDRSGTAHTEASDGIQPQPIDLCQINTPTAISIHCEAGNLFSKRSYEDSSSPKSLPNSPSLLSIIFSKADQKQIDLLCNGHGAPVAAPSLQENRSGCNDIAELSGLEEEFMDCLEIGDA